MNGLFNVVEEVRMYGKKEICADKLTISDCFYLYEHGVEMEVDSRRQIYILKLQQDFKKDNQDWRYFIYFN